MMHRFTFEAFDRTFQDIMRPDDADSLGVDYVAMPFGGKTIVFGGDFRQILHVVPRGDRGDIVNATFNSSKLWQNY